MLMLGLNQQIHNQYQPAEMSGWCLRLVYNSSQWMANVMATVQGVDVSGGCGFACRWSPVHIIGVAAAKGW